MAEAKAGGKEKNPMADAANWNARVLTEIEAPHKWSEYSSASPCLTVLPLA